jgi:hypothetical protein
MNAKQSSMAITTDYFTIPITTLLKREIVSLVPSSFWMARSWQEPVVHPSKATTCQPQSGGLSIKQEPENRMSGITSVFDNFFHVLIHY